MSDLNATADEMIGYTRGTRDERTRVVAALRFEAEAAAKMPGEVWAGVAAAMAGAANYIERGDHTKPGRP